ncbi:MAG: PEP-CTERM/exosortase system-associated acyltransferase [Alteromonadaceae bacterium TMED7]|jgi:N-acyl amino acid synthase of PEP-CTERM/exosortase system|nr:MAG: PEP-CTERM/exosortase system-associated acyltransferase [Alteromonadaceae bacterium TMED7]|tara:strand:+ start:2010 stop:2837 length:828 start_codon:yes stop_codon:yes gene_type:complete
MPNLKNKNILDTVTKLVGKNNKLGKLLSGYGKLKEANYISAHFSSYLVPVVANSNALKNEVFKIRHGVYCEELSFEPVKESGLELDDFDAFSVHCLIKHCRSSAFAGTVRIVRPTEAHQKLPIEKYCLNSITDNTLNPSNFDRRDVCEVSRLAVPKQFRRRQMDNHQGAGVGTINQTTYSDTELRCFPFIAVGLYFAAAALALENDIKHAYVMMEPRLARSMGFVGIKFKQIGPVVDYHGKRAPYYINQELLNTKLSPSFLRMLTDIRQSLSDEE